MSEVSAGRILIMAVGNYNAATPYEPLDLVAYNDESWLCRKACTGVTPTAQASEYWQKFGSAVGIATVSNTGIVRPDGSSIKIIADGTISVPTATGEALGLVKPDGSTITIDANGTLTANAAGALSDLTDVNISSASQGQILQYNVTSHKWENVTKQFLTELEQMLDVDIDNSTLADGQALIYDVATGKWQNKAIAQYPKLDTVEQVMANTQSGKVADALAIKTMNTAAVKKFSDSTYVTVDSIAYDETNQVLGLKVNGADTVIPFKKGGMTEVLENVQYNSYSYNGNFTVDKAQSQFAIIMAVYFNTNQNLSAATIKKNNVTLTPTYENLFPSSGNSYFHCRTYIFDESVEVGDIINLTFSGGAAFSYSYGGLML